MSIITNWKLLEVLKDVEIVADDVPRYRDQVLEKLNIPTPDTINVLDRSATIIDWTKMPEHWKFSIDNRSLDHKFHKILKRSAIGQTSRVIIEYGVDEPAVSVPTKLFIKDWEDFFASTKWETVIFSEDYKLIIEVTRDFMIHSNFKIL